MFMTGKEIYGIYLKKPELYGFLLRTCAVAPGNYDAEISGMKAFKKHIIATLEENSQKEATKCIFKLRIGNKANFFDFSKSLFLRSGVILTGSELEKAEKIYDEDCDYEGNDDEVKIFGIVPSQNKITQCYYDGDYIHDEYLFSLSDEVLEVIASFMENKEYFIDRVTYNNIFKQCEPDVIYCIHCDEVVHPLRIAILKEKEQEITCLSCAEKFVQRVVGVQTNFDKACRQVEVVTPEQGRRLTKLIRKTGMATGGPGFGPKAGKVVFKG